MSRSQLLRSTAFMAACLLTLSGCSVGWTGARGTSSAPPDQAQDAAPEAAEEPTGKLEDTSPMDPLEYGNCTSSDIQDYDDELTDNDAEDTRAQAEAQVTKVIPASNQVSVTANELSTDQVVKVSAGARDVTITAQGLVVVIEGEIESLTINGFDNTVWVGASNKVTFGANDGDSQNYVFWHSRPPQAKVDPQGLNIIGKDVHAPVVRSCRSFS